MTFWAFESFASDKCQRYLYIALTKLDFLFCFSLHFVVQLSISIINLHDSNCQQGDFIYTFISVKNQYL